jgi:hypothetical protein
VPGRYAAFASSTGEGDFYSDPAFFDIADADVTGLEIKVHRGSAITGVVIFEGEVPEDAPRLSTLRIGANVTSQSINEPRFAPIIVAPDGSFRAAGLQPGTAIFHVAMYPAPKGLSLVRVERDGVDHPEGIEIGAGEQVTGVKIVLAYGTGVIRGQVNIEGGTVTRMMVACRRKSSSPFRRESPVFPDSRGRFSIDGLMQGEYEISLAATVASSGGGPPRQKFLTQTLSITNGMETQVTFVIDLNEKQR